MKIVIGTVNKVKITGIKNAIHASPFFHEKEVLEYKSYDFDADASDMPMSLQTIITGAQKSVMQWWKQAGTADYIIGLRGGIVKISGRAYILWMMYIENDKQEGHMGFSPMIEIPMHMQNRIYMHKEELKNILKEISEKVTISTHNWAIGAFSNDMLTRVDAIEKTFHAAIAPFFNEYYTFSSLPQQNT